MQWFERMKLDRSAGQFLPLGSECWSCGFQTIPHDILALAYRLSCSPQPAPYCWQSLQPGPAWQKAGFPGGFKTPLSMSPTTCPGPADTRRRVTAPATCRPEAHFPHPGRGERQTWEGGGWGWAPGPPPPRPARGRARAATPVAAGRRGGRHRSFPLTQRQRSGWRAPENCSKRTVGTLRSVRWRRVGGSRRSIVYFFHLIYF